MHVPKFKQKIERQLLFSKNRNPGVGGVGGWCEGIYLCLYLKFYLNYYSWLW